MSSLRAIDLMVVDDLVDFVRGRGFVLDFSDQSFAQFFATELDVDIDDLTYAVNGGSKGKRLKCFLQKIDDRTALRCETVEAGTPGSRLCVRDLSQVIVRGLWPQAA